MAKKAEPLKLYDVNVCAPDFWELPPNSPRDVCQEWAIRCVAFVEAMRSLDRTVLLHDEEGKLYLSSISDTASELR